MLVERRFIYFDFLEFIFSTGLLGSREVGEGFQFMKQAADLGIAEVRKGHHTSVSNPISILFWS